MSLTQILIPLIYLFFFSNVAFVLGYFVLDKIRAHHDDFLFNLSYSVLLGYGILAYFTLFLSFFGSLNKAPIFIFGLAVLGLGYRSLLYLYQNLKKVIASILQQTSFNKILLGFLAFLIFLASLSALMPPFRTDIIIYHLPEVKAIAKDGILNFLENTRGTFDGSIPLLMEILYAMSITVNGFTLAHLIHYQIFLALVLAIYVFLRTKFTKTHGLLACLFVFTIFELVVNATSAYVDAAMVSFNIAGLLIFIDWFFFNRRSSLILSALLFGLAASVKYLAFYNLLVVGILVLFKLIILDRKKFWEITKTSLIFFGFWLIPAGFWYLKNLIFYLNPVYPLFFGHPGTSDIGYVSSAMQGIFKTFYPRTLWGFLTMPFRAFWEPHYWTILLSFLTLPFIVFIRKRDLIQKNKKVIIFLFTYLISFFSLWFFMGAHQRRFVMDGQVILMTLAAIILGTILIKIIEKIKLVWLVILIIFISIPLFFAVARYENHYLIETERLQIEYLLGIKNKYDFYRFQNLGEEFLVAKYINENFQNKKIINNLCTAEGNFFLNQGNLFISLSRIPIKKNEDPWLQLSEYFKKNDINYLLVDWEEKEKNYHWRSGACTPDWQWYKDKILNLENLVKEHSRLIFFDDKGGVELYRINLE